MSKCIMIVDDDPMICQLLARFLGMRKYVTYLASNGVEALTILNKRPCIQMVLTDVNMPQMDGLTLLEEIRKMNTALPVIVMSGLRDATLEDKCQCGGSTAFISKPFDLHNLINLIESKVAGMPPCEQPCVGDVVQ